MAARKGRPGDTCPPATYTFWSSWMRGRRGLVELLDIHRIDLFDYRFKDVALISWIGIWDSTFMGTWPSLNPPSSIARKYF